MIAELKIALDAIQTGRPVPAECIPIVSPIIDRELSRMSSVYTFKRLDNGWLVGDGDRVEVFKHKKGFGVIHRLVCHPTREIHALDFYYDGLPCPDDMESVTLDNAEMTDARAVREVGARIIQIRESLDDEQDPLIMAELKAEEDRLREWLREVESTKGFRKFADETERARKAVLKNYKTALDDIGAIFPELRDHFEKTISTGYYLCYGNKNISLPKWEK